MIACSIMRGIAVPRSSGRAATLGPKLIAAVLLISLCVPAAADDGDDRKLIGQPGYTLTDDLLRADIMRVARLSLPHLVGRKTGDEKDRACGQTDFIDAMITEIGDGSIGERTWSEAWTFQLCERTVQVPVKFEPDRNGGGTTFTLSDSGMKIGGKSGAAP